MKQQKGVNWTPIFNEHRGQWVALDEDETTVLASGASAKTVLQTAKKKGIEVPLLLKVPKNPQALVG